MTAARNRHETKNMKISDALSEKLWYYKYYTIELEKGIVYHCLIMDGGINYDIERQEE